MKVAKFQIKKENGSSNWECKVKKRKQSGNWVIAEFI